MKRIVSIVLNNFRNDSRVLKECQTLKRYGYDVKVVALHDNDLKVNENVQEIPVHRMKLGTKFLPKIIAIQFIKYIEFALKTIYLYRKVDIIHCNDLEPLPIAVLIKKISNNSTKIVYDAHEYETESNGLRGFKKKIMISLEKILIKYVDKVITVSPSIAKEYQKNYSISLPSLVLNCPQYQITQKMNHFREKFDISENKRIFLYQGSLSKGRGVEFILEAFKNVSKEAVLVVMGYGELEELVQTYAEQNENIYFHEAVSPEVLLEYTSSADVGICLIEDTCLSYYYCLPNKFFEYAMAGLPIISSNLFELRGLINKYQCGWIVEERSSVLLQKKIDEALKSNIKELSVNSKKMAEEYCWENQEKSLIHAYNELNYNL